MSWPTDISMPAGEVREETTMENDGSIAKRPDTQGSPNTRTVLVGTACERRVARAAPHRLYESALLIAVGVSSCALSMFLGRRASVWFDEGYSIMISRRPVGELIRLTSVDAHPPLYYLVLKLWGSCFSWQEWSLRLLSAIFAGLAAAVTVLLIKELASPSVAALSAPLLVIAPYHLRFGYEIRMYSLASLIVVAATLMLARAVRMRRKRFWIAYAALVALGMSTLFVTATVWITQFLLLTVASVRRRMPWGWLEAYALALGLYVPYLPFALHQVLSATINPLLSHGMTLAALGDTLSLFVLARSGDGIGPVQTLLCLFVAAIPFWYMFHVGGSRATASSQTAQARDRRACAVLAAMAVMPLGVFAAIDALRQLAGVPLMYVPRYASFVSMFFYALVAVALTDRIQPSLLLSARSRVIAACAVVCVVAISLIGIANLDADGNRNFGERRTPMAETERAHIVCSPDNTILAVDAFMYIETAYYFDGCALRFLATHEIALSGGYAPLHGSPARISDAHELRTPTVTVLTWVSDRKPLDDPRYRLVHERAFSRQKVSTYALR